MFDGGSLHRGDINPSQLIEDLTIKNAAGTAIAGAIVSAEVSNHRIELLLDHSKFASGDIGQSLTIEYDGSNNTIRSISGDFAESFTQNFSYQPKIGFSGISNVGTAGNIDAYTLTFSGGKLDDTNAANATAQEAVKSALSIYTDSGYNNALASSVIKSVTFAGVDKAAGAAAGSAVGSGTVTIELDQTYLQGQGVSNGDTLYLRYSADDADDVLVDASSNDVDPFEVSFTANMSNMPSVNGVAYAGEAVEISFGTGVLDGGSDKGIVKSQLKIYRGDNNTGLITGAIDSVDSIANGKVGFSLNKAALRAAGVGNGETLYIDYDTSTTGLKSDDSTPVGDFNQEFTVKLSPDFDLANMMADGLSTLNLTFYDDSGLDLCVITMQRRKRLRTEGSSDPWMSLKYLFQRGRLVITERDQLQQLSR